MTIRNVTRMIGMIGAATLVALATAHARTGNGDSTLYSGENLDQIAMPIGGIGTGSIALTGIGGLQDFSIRHMPEFSAQVSCWHNLPGGFALLHVGGEEPVTRLCEGPVPSGRIYANGTKSLGFREGGHEGMPRFEECSFRGEFPFGTVELTDDSMPLAVSLRGYNPFIPRDDVASGIPCAILEYTIANPTAQRIEFDFSYHLSHLAGPHDWQNLTTRNETIPGRGVVFTNTEDPLAPRFGSATLSVVGHDPVIKGMWLRSAWWDSLSALWREVSTGTFQANAGSNGFDIAGRNGGSILMAGALEPGEAVTYPVLITWHFPNPETVKGTHEDTVLANPPWRPFYVSQWADAREVMDYVHDDYDSLRSRTEAFHDALFGSTLPPAVLDAVASNLAIMKSPTVLRQENGNLWAWEGVCHQRGSCFGSCTHVWNYAQAFPNLFPALERTLREMELERSMFDDGYVRFRSALPDGPPKGRNVHAAADGQLGGIMKLYRDWQISGDREWLARLYPLAQRSLDYCIRTWDPDRLGVLIEPHHNTYDINFWGPDGMCSSIYVGALSAMAAMAHDLGRPDEEARPYEELAERGARYLEENLFNGEYFYQDVQWEDARDRSFADMHAALRPEESELHRVLYNEGPRYQYGTGCLSDGVIGAWMARIYGIDTPLARDNVRSHLASIFRYNFKPDLSEHACLQRPGFAMGHEAGLLLCTWPRGGKPTLPFVYSDEVWTGIEYQVASHLIEVGLVDEGLRIVEGVRSRYDGHVRNPFNEYECGSYYARAQSSYALLGSLSGFRYSMPTRTLRFGPRLGVRPFETFFSTDSGFGMIGLTDDAVTIRLIEGELAVDTLVLTLDGVEQTIRVDDTARPDAPVTLPLG